MTAEALGKDGGGVRRKDERQDPVEVYFSADGMGCQGGIHDHHCILPPSVFPQRILGKVASFGLSSVGVGVGPALGIQPNSPYPRPSPPLTRKSLSPGEG